jgi:hypothetical protein
MGGAMAHGRRTEAVIPAELKSIRAAFRCSVGNSTGAPEAVRSTWG